MTKAEIVKEITKNTGVDRADVANIVEEFMSSVRNSLLKKNNVYLRGFGSFIIVHRAAKIGRNITKNTTLEVPAHDVVSFKPSPKFAELVK